ncbi:MAG: TonB C-terminal domain-containing protein [Rhodocyclaceae bacterium]|nr:TonB C-terminal domain-containing protein [Rhodocyclaceae bacterium]MCA3024974.1 TonB C-terminal domain-containing protein [Rhodocyclaceae bacterium]MCA3033231.1 TonB C-terminal domain-containing protein [Rhodocyclaceae bacterium]MCA3036665.1 TonB C-terminal domain-containing protein [Rhodocyclaceae bacterium]MCA3045009.1 TonB C-terminal domain-containing protein [Rhodocyclaceae bacterium]
MAAALPPHLPPKLSATGRSVLHARREPGRAIAGAFAIVVHIGFFALIIFGVSWQVKMPSPISAELWSTLPPSVNRVAEPPPAPQEEPAAPPEPKVAEQKVAEPNKADIALKAKKEREEKLKREKEEKLAAELKKRDEQKRTEDKRKAEEDKQRKADEAKRQAEADKLRLEAEARAAAAQSARDKAVSDYTGKIAALIRNRANIPDSVTGQPIIQVRVRLLTNGTVFEATVGNPSGNKAYDDAVERAINGIRQWPVPDDPEILGRQRELLLNIKHER